LPTPNVAESRLATEEAVARAREVLNVLKLELQILGTALTTIYESHSKGLINEAERDRLLEKYKVDLASLQKTIGEKQRIVDLFDLESEREQLVKNFRARLSEIEAQVKTLSSGGVLNRSDKINPVEQSSIAVSSEPVPARKNPIALTPRKSSESEQQQINDTEKRIEQIRAEILHAMDRLEQIESEG
jgi:hypothetical protein